MTMTPLLAPLTHCASTHACVIMHECCGLDLLVLCQMLVCKKQKCLCVKAMQRVKDIVPIHSYGLMAFPHVCPAYFTHSG